MKNLFTRLMLVAVAAMGFVACQDAIDEVVVAPQANEIVMTFVAGAPESRTSVSIYGNTAEYSWSVDENRKLTDRVVFLQTQNANEDVNYKYSEESSSVDNGVAKFVTTFKAVENATNYNYAAIFPAQNISATTLESVGVKLPETQTLTEGSYDPAADLMMSKIIKDIAPDNNHGGNLQFSRLAAIGRMNLKGVTEGETINKVVITFEEEVVNGNVTINFEGETATYAETGGNSITLHNGALTALAEGTPIYFTCFPGEYSGAYSVEVTTDKAKYSTGANKSIAADKALSFTAGNVTRFNLTVGNRVASDIKTYTKLTNANLADYSGTYLLVYEAGNVAFDGSLAPLDAERNFRTVKISDSTITGAHSDIAFTIEKVEGGYSIKSASGKYIGRSDNSNGLDSSDNSLLNTIDNLVIEGSGGCALKYNNASNQNRFRYYKSGQQDIALYRQNGTGSDEEIQLVQLAKPTNLKAVAKGNVVDVTWDAVENATNYDVTVGGNTTNVTTNSASLTLDYKTTYTIQVVAKGGVGYTDSEVAEVEVITGEEPAVGAGETVTYTVSSTSACTTEGTAPAGSSATYAQTYNNAKEQMTSGNSATFTLKGYAGATIKAITLNMKSNKSAGAGTFSVVAGAETLAAIATATNFNSWYDNTSYGNTYRDVHVTMLNDSYAIQSEENVVIKFEATTNSIYIHSVTITYVGGDSNTDEGGDDSGDDNGEGGEDNTSSETAWTLVTDASTLAVGDKVVIAAKDSNYAISTTQNNNNRGQARVTKDGETITFGDDVQILTLEAGTTTGSFAFYTGSGYLYAASSSANHLKTNTAKDDNGSWDITIASDGVATVVAQGNYTRNTMQYNKSSSLFACYGSASQQAIAIYKYIDNN